MAKSTKKAAGKPVKVKATKAKSSRPAKIKPPKLKAAKLKAAKLKSAKSGPKSKKARNLAVQPVAQLPPPAAIGASPAVLDRLFAVVTSRRDADPNASHSARLLARGPAKVAQKFGEEAVECLIEAVTGNKQALIGESADVLYHLVVMWVAAGIRPDDVWAELRRREGVSGIAEKASRAVAAPLARALGTAKIP